MLQPGLVAREPAATGTSSALDCLSVLTEGTFPSPPAPPGAGMEAAPRLQAGPADLSGWAPGCAAPGTEETRRLDPGNRNSDCAQQGRGLRDGLGSDSSRPGRRPRPRGPGWAAGTPQGKCRLAGGPRAPQGVGGAQQPPRPPTRRPAHPAVWYHSYDTKRGAPWPVCRTH